jgi:serine/threonine-protein kinase
MSNDVHMRSFEGATIIDRYRLEKFLDEGAFGAVFRATHLVYGVELREVAVKLAKRPMSDGEAGQFFSDALLMARVVDMAMDATLRQHFVTVHDAGRCTGGDLADHPYLVMELVDSGSLADCLHRRAFPLTRAVEYFDQILKAVAYMHSSVAAGGRRRQAIAHRDLKPSNILVVQREGAPDVLKITDFGLAVEVDSLLGWVESGGDLAYLAPESFSRGICSPQSDVYMLGLVFYEMLTGKNPFAEVGTHLRGADEADRAELRRLHLAARQIERFAEFDNHVELRRRPELIRVLRPALEADPGTRPYQNAIEMRAAWEQAKAGVSVAKVEQPWDIVKRLTAEAQQCIAVGDRERGAMLLREAMEINQDALRIPAAMVVGRCYLLMVEHLLKQGDKPASGRLANEGYQRRRCRSTCLALARYYEAEGSPLAALFEMEAAQFPDQE